MSSVFKKQKKWMNFTFTAAFSLALNLLGEKIYSIPYSIHPTIPLDP